MDESMNEQSISLPPERHPSRRNKCRCSPSYGITSILLCAILHLLIYKNSWISTMANTVYNVEDTMTKTSKPTNQHNVPALVNLIVCWERY